MSTSDVHTLAGAYALDAVTELERAAFAHHIDDCETCAFEVAELQETAARLADPAWAVPPPALREAVLAEVVRTPQLRNRPAGGDSGRALRAVGAVRAEQAAQAPASEGPGRWRRWTAAAVAAGVVAAGAGVAGWAVTQRQVRAEQARAAQVSEVLAAPDAELRSVAMAGGQVTVVLSPSRNAGVVVLAGLADPGPDRGYQLWLVKSENYRAVGLLGTGERGGSVRIGPLDGSETFGVSVEPAGGSHTGKPTEPVVGVIGLA